MMGEQYGLLGKAAAILVYDYRQMAECKVPS